MQDLTEADNILSKIEGTISAGKLTKKEDEIDIVVHRSTWARIFTFVGGYQVILPYVFLVILFALFNFQRESAVQEWANNASSE